MEDNVGISEDLRCKRTDGKQWRCNALSMPNKTVCEKHYIQAKKRAMNSALRASLKKGKRKSSNDANIYMESKIDELERSRPASPVNVGGMEFAGSVPGKRYKEKLPKSQSLHSSQTARVSLKPNNEVLRDAQQVEENHTKSAYSTPPSSKEVLNFSGSGPGEYSGRSTDSSEEAEGLTCHQCRRNDRMNVIWCMSCDRKGYCDKCISKWYADIPVDDIERVCPACRGICNCRVCLDNLIKVRIQEIAGIDKLKYLHSLLSFLLPVLRRIHSEQCFELGVETRLYGAKTDIPRAKINADEQMCCDFCRIPIFDYHRHCTNCLYDLCLTCCRDLRRASLVGVKGESAECRVIERGKVVSNAVMQPESSRKKIDDELLVHSVDKSAIDFSHLFPKWKANSEGSIPCGPVEGGGCGSSKLVLRRIFKMNWVAKLVKNAEEMINGCKLSALDSSDRCVSCTGGTTSQSSGSTELCQCSHRDDANDNFLYYPALKDIKHGGISHFHKHWVKGEPIIIKHAFEHSLASSWDPMSIWRGIQEIVDERMKEDSIIVKAIDCLNQKEVNIELDQFIKGYKEGHKHEDGWPKMLILKDWPPPSTLEEFISYQMPEFLSKLPLVEFIHSKWGILNLAAKLPHDTLQNEVGPKIFIAYGTQEELGSGDSVLNLQIKMGDLVYLLMHTSEVNLRGRQRSQKSEKTSMESGRKESFVDAHTVYSTTNLDERAQPPDVAPKEHSQLTKCGSGYNLKKDEIMKDQICDGTEIASAREADSSNSDKGIVDVREKAHAGAIWDVFRRQDVPKLNEYLRVHQEEFANIATRPVVSAMHPVYGQGFYLNKDHKRKLKEEFRIEPWTFEQHVCEAVFIPAGCPFQVRNLQSSVQLGLDFLSPESLGESVHLANEIRSLPNDHDAKLNMMEVSKMSLYAASSAIREIQKITLDPKLSSDIGFEDRNLTAKVSENLERLAKRRQILCT